ELEQLRLRYEALLVQIPNAFELVIYQIDLTLLSRQLCLIARNLRLRLRDALPIDLRFAPLHRRSILEQGDLSLDDVQDARVVLRSCEQLVREAHLRGAVPLRLEARILRKQHLALRCKGID